MSRLLRLILTLLKFKISPFKSSIGDTFTFPLRVWPTDADLHHVNNAIYLTYFECARLEILLSTGLMKLCQTQKWRPVVTTTLIRYHASLKRKQPFTIKSFVKTSDKHSFYVYHHITDVSGKTMTKCITRTMLLSKTGKVPVNDVYTKLGIEIPQYQESNFSDNWSMIESWLR